MCIIRFDVEALLFLKWVIFPRRVSNSFLNLSLSFNLYILSFENFIILFLLKFLGGSQLLQSYFDFILGYSPFFCLFLSLRRILLFSSLFMGSGSFSETSGLADISHFYFLVPLLALFLQWSFSYSPILSFLIFSFLTRQF